MTVPRARRGLAAQGGFSLIELMIASLIGLILLAGVVLIAINASQTQRDLEQIGRQIENGRYAVSILEDVIPHAGYYGEFYDVPPGSGTPDACSTDPDIIEDHLWLPIQAYDNPTGSLPSSLDCIANHIGGTDILVIRRASTRTTPIDSLTAGEIYIQVRPGDFILETADGPNDSAFSLEDRNGNPAPIHKFHVDIFYLSPGGDAPLLMRESLGLSGGSLQFSDEPLVEGIEQLQFDYGIDRDGDGTPEESTPGSSSDAYVTDPASSGNEADVMTVQASVLARSIKPFEGYTDEKTYFLGLEGGVSPGGSYRRRVFVTVLRAVNPSIRRQ